VAALNEAWGTAFWSQDYRSFDEVDPPNLTVTEANPAHRMDYQRFASDEVVSFNRMQAEIIRAASPGRDVVHNFMGLLHRLRSSRRRPRISMWRPGTAIRSASSIRGGTTRGRRSFTSGRATPISPLSTMICTAAAGVGGCG
jgi:hypothetical protein